MTYMAQFSCISYHGLFAAIHGRRNHAGNACQDIFLNPVLCQELGEENNY